MTWTKGKTRADKKVAKWICGNSWVTVWTAGDVFYGINGEPQGRFDGTADEAKAYIEERVKAAQ